MDKTIHMKPIFNSLGSNYDFNFVKLALKQISFGGGISVDVNRNNDASIDSLQQYLDKAYQGKSFLFYKGRDAIEFSLRILLGEGNVGEDNDSSVKYKVLTQAFSCFAVEEGIKRAGMIPVYVDVREDSTNMSVQTLIQALESNKDAKAVLVQHSLGIPADIIEIRKWCNKHNLLLIEDLAQAIGGFDKADQPLGTNSDVVIFSFSRDKIIDAVSGGAVVFKNLSNEQREKIEIILTNDLEKITKKIIFKDMIYPFITYFGRKTHDVLIGKIILKLSRIFGLITSPAISRTSKLSMMSPAYAELVLRSFIKLEKQLIHRRKIASFYLDKISNQNIKVVNTKNDVETGSNLRFSIRTTKVDKLINLMKDHKIYLSDRWYRSAVDCGKQACHTEYKSGLAVNAEKLANEIFNLPTHRNISLKKASRIIDVLNKF